jgi:MFS family permease
MTTQIERVGPETRTERGRPGWLMLAILLAGQFMCIIDVFVVNVAMPSIGADLHASGASLQLIVGGYTIGYAMLLITCARLGERYGRRRMYLVGVTLFTAASLACALAPATPALIAFRFVQGAGAAAAVPQIFSIIQLRFTGRARARALSAYAAVLSSGAVAGLVLGGMIVSANLFGQSWRPVFAVNVPIGILLMTMVPRALPSDEPRTEGAGGKLDISGLATGGKFDIPGLATGAAAVLLLVFPLVLGQETGWPAWTFASLAAGVAASVLFVRVERNLAARGGHPLLNLDVLRSPGLPSGLTALALSQIGYGGLLFTFTLYLQAGLGRSALRAGLSYLPMAVAFGLIGFYWRRLPSGLHRVLPTAGLALSALGYLGLAAAARSGHEAATYAALTAVGAGLGLSVSPLLTRSLAHVPPDRAADASGLLTTSVQLSQLAGVAALGSVYLAVPHSMSTTACAMATLSATGVVSLMCRNARN